MKDIRTIVVPVVFTPTGRRALDVAKEEAREAGADLVLVSAAAVGDHVAERVELLQDRLAEIEKEMVDEGLPCTSEWFVGESLAEATLYVAEERSADLIVMGLRRRTPVGKALLGSYERDVLLDATCPVICIPAALD